MTQMVQLEISERPDKSPLNGSRVHPTGGSRGFAGIVGIFNENAAIVRLPLRDPLGARS